MSSLVNSQEEQKVQLVTRRATIEDLSKILLFPPVYAGHDYLPYRIEAWLNDQERFTYIVVAGEDELVVALDSVVRTIYTYYIYIYLIFQIYF